MRADAGVGGASRAGRGWGGRPLGGLLAMVVALSAWAAAEAQMTFPDSRFTVETVATLTPFDTVGLEFAPDGRMFVWARTGVVHVIKNGTVLPTPFIDVGASINTTIDNGLLGLALDPALASSGHVYLLYNYKGGGSRLTRVTADPANPDVALAGSEVVILGDIPPDKAHSIGSVLFGPDGKLFVGVGDLASYGYVDPDALAAQDVNTYAGKLLRINPDGTAPPDNPFYDGPGSIRSKVWAYGLRNPFRFSFHPLTGVPFLGDVGWNDWEEINRATAGSNHGWPCYEGNNPTSGYSARFPQCQALPRSATVAPVYAYSHSQGVCAVGGVFYTAVRYAPEYRGSYFFPDFGRGWIRRLVIDANGALTSVHPFADPNELGPTALRLGPDGLLYLMAFNTGQILRIRFSGPVARASASPLAGYSPLTVSFSSAGSADPLGGTLAYRWDFGDGTVAAVPNPVHTYTASSPAQLTARLTVTDSTGLTGSAAVTVTVGSLPPTATIVTPLDDAAVFVGDVVTFEGRATDPDDGSLPPAALSWTILLNHNEHSHAFASVPGTGGSFTVVDHGQGSFGYELILSATDSSGLTSSTSVLLPFNPQGLPYPISLAFAPAAVVGTDSFAGTVTLATAAPGGGATVALATDLQSVHIPPSVTVLGGALSARFIGTTSAVGAPAVATISASLNGVIREPLAVHAPPVLVGLAVSPSPVLGGTTLTGTVSLSGPAPASGVTVGLSSTSSAVDVPPAVTVAGGNRQATFAATTSPVSAPLAVTLTASFNGSVTTTVTVSDVLGLNQGDRTALVTAGWDFLARTPGGVSRNSERTTGLTVSYDQAAHPGVIRVPADLGTLWGSANNTRNTLFRDLPGEWTSIRVKIAAFAPVADFQSMCLLAYQHDDHYVAVCRNRSTSQMFQWWHETNGAPVVLAKVATTATAGIHLRLDREGATNAVTAFVSTDDGGTWVPLPGRVVKPLSSPRLGLFVGGNASPSVVAADLAAVQILVGATAPAALTVSPGAVSFSGTAGGPAPASQVLTIGGASGLAWSVQSDRTWLAGSPLSGTTPGSVSVTANLTGLAPGTHSATLVLTATGTATPPVRVPVTLNLGGVSQPAQIDLGQGTRAALLAAGWSFLARTPAGTARDTERLSGLVVSYDQSVHPGVLRIPADVGTPWAAANNTRNTLFRDLPPDWESLRLRIASFSPAGNYQSACLLAYQDDNHYVAICRNHSGSHMFQWWHEVNGLPTSLGKLATTATTDIHLRLDRARATETISAFVSTDSGASWIPLPGTVAKVLAAPRLGLFVGGNASASVPVADLDFVEIRTGSAGNQP